MINVSEFLSLVAQNTSRVKKYELGYDGSNGKCDCIGLIIGALRMGGETWSGIHGSNYTARSQMRTLFYIGSAAELMPGYIVYKAKDKNDSGYALPDRYKSGDDLLDYYHVGVVTSVEPLEITHCTSVEGGIKRDSSLGAWAYAGELQMVDYAADDAKEPMETYIVTGGRLAMREGPGTTSKVKLWIPSGAAVQARESGTEGWARVLYDGKSGYSMNKYLILDANKPDDSVTLTLERSVAEKLLKALQEEL